MGHPRLKRILIALLEIPSASAHCFLVSSFPPHRMAFPFGLTDKERASSIVHPYLSLILNVPGRILNSSANSIKSRFFLRKKRNRLFDLFRACCLYVAQTQFPFEYGPLLFLRSSVCCADGRGPMSFKKARKELLHFLETKIPRFPYQRNWRSFGLWHLDRIPLQIRYSDNPGMNERAIYVSQLALSYKELNHGARG